MSCCVMIGNVMKCYEVLCYVMLFYVILCYFMLFYVILCCVIVGNVRLGHDRLLSKLTQFMFLTFVKSSYLDMQI